MPAVLTVVEAMRFAAHGLTPAVLADVELGGIQRRRLGRSYTFQFFHTSGRGGKPLSVPRSLRHVT
jgi:hypothetical protein